MDYRGLTFIFAGIVLLVVVIGGKAQGLWYALLTGKPAPPGFGGGSGPGGIIPPPVNVPLPPTGQHPNSEADCLSRKDFCSSTGNYLDPRCWCWG